MCFYLRPRPSLRGHICPLVGRSVRHANLKTVQKKTSLLSFFIHDTSLPITVLFSFSRSFIYAFIHFIKNAHLLIQS